VAHTEVSTKDLGNTGMFTFDATINGANFELEGVATTGTWTARVITRVII
jgi:hypothetical protein